MNYISTVAASLHHCENEGAENPDEDALLRARRVVRRLEDTVQRQRWIDVFECVVRIVENGEDRPWPIRRHPQPAEQSGTKLPDHYRTADPADAKV